MSNGEAAISTRLGSSLYMSEGTFMNCSGNPSALRIADTTRVYLNDLTFYSNQTSSDSAIRLQASVALDFTIGGYMRFIGKNDRNNPPSVIFSTSSSASALIRVHSDPLDPSEWSFANLINHPSPSTLKPATSASRPSPSLLRHHQPVTRSPSLISSVPIFLKWASSIRL
jgi:hypothetical protein